MSGGSILTIANGSRFWRYQSKSNEYFESYSGYLSVPGKSGEMRRVSIREFVQTMFAVSIHAPFNAKNPLRLPDAEVEIGKRKIPCFVIEVLGPSEGETSRYWIDQARFMVVQDEIEIVRDAFSRHQVDTFDFIQLNLPIEEAVFEFEPPNGAKAIPPPRNLTDSHAK